MSRLSVRVRATLAATAIVAVALGVAAAVLVGVLMGSLVESASAEATRRADATADVLAAQTKVDKSDLVAGQVIDPDIMILHKSFPADTSEDAPVAPDSPGTVPEQPLPEKGIEKDRSGVLPASALKSLLVGSGGTVVSDVSPALPPDAKADLPSVKYAELSPREYSVISPAGEWTSLGSFTVATTQVPTEQGPLLVQARASLEPTKNALNTLQSLLLPGIPALLLLVAALTWLVVGRALAPVSAIREEMADITASDLHRRVPVPRSRDEIARLAETMNSALDRLEHAVNRHKRFVADAAHELRSPLAILRTRLELAPREPLVAETLTDVERIQKLTSDLLLLARLDAGEPACHEEVELGQVAAEEAARPRPRPEVRVRLDVAVDAVVRGSADQLRRLVANLMDNAVRHAASTVTLRLTLDGGQAVLDVRDDGPGIPAEHRVAVFDRFTRLDEARDRDAGGSGLGLAIARDIAVRHGGSLDLVEETPGAWLRARFPVI
ncbi:ATP-binding protein [Streptosporangium sp. NPDC051023]|uniref:sensor histidine kinase n=1 Tax=Streptosporangium sp. NPDC051023 TaxID=3155410 RepID=UPI00344D9DF2